MNKFWAIFAHEYTRQVLRKGFLIGLLALPLWLLFSGVMGIASVLLVTSRAPVGYVDQSGRSIPLSLPNDQTLFTSRVEFKPYDHEAQARAALDARQIQAYLILPQDYADQLNARLVYAHKPAAGVQGQITDFLRLYLMSSQPKTVAYRVLDGAKLVIQAEHENKPAPGTNWIKTALPMVAAVFLMIAVFSSSGYLMHAVVEEKENRTMELLATSASPVQIMGGKITALILVGLTQIAAWCIVPALGLYYVTTQTPYLQGLSLDWGPLGLALLTILPTFVFISALMAAIGATITESNEGQQVSSLVTMPIMLPLFLSGLIAINPNGPLAVILSFFPLTTTMTLLIRMGFATTPTWQIALCLVILSLCAAGSLWLAGRIFRAGMLRYGKRMGWKDVFSALRPAESQKAGVHE